MDKTSLIVLMCLAGCCAALEIVILGPKELEMKAGEKLHLVCNVDKGLRVVVDNMIQWLHYPSLDPETPTVLSSSQTIDPAAAALGWEIVVVDGTESTNFSLSIAKVTVAMDGKFVCRDVSETDSPPSAEIAVVFTNNVQSIELVFDGEIISDVNEVAIQREEGTFGVTCSADGFNPNAKISISIGDVEKETTPMVVELDETMSGEAKSPRYKGSVSINELLLTSDYNGQVVKCEAAASFEGAAKKVASVPLSVITFEPTIECSDNTSAREGYKYIKIKCKVFHDKVNVESYSWLIEDMEERIFVGNHSESYNKIEVTELEPGKVTEVALNLYKVNDEYFDTPYYLYVHLDNGEYFREKTSLLKLDKVSGSASRPVAYVLCFFLALFVSL